MSLDWQYRRRSWTARATADAVDAVAAVAAVAAVVAVVAEEEAAAVAVAVAVADAELPVRRVPTSDPGCSSWASSAAVVTVSRNFL